MFKIGKLYGGVKAHDCAFRSLRESSERKRINKSVVIAIIVAEVLAAAIAFYAVFCISWSQISARRCEAVAAVISSFDAKSLKANTGRAMVGAKEQVREKVDETVWTLENVNYRIGPDTKYDRAGTLGIYTSVKRTGLTFNDWSRVIVDGNEYYILSEFLTTEVPIITDTGAKGEYQKYALSLLPEYGWAESEIYPLIKLWNRESNWNPHAHNRRSGAHGIPQALPASKMASAGSDYYTNGNTQIRWGLGYIAGRYGSPSRAWAHSQSHGWY